MGEDSQLTALDKKNAISIFVPTYSRVESLRLTVASIFEHWKLNDLAKIIISDNNDNDIANDVVEEFDLNFITYSKNPVNIGMDKNMLRYIDLCDSKYCWLLGDDDLLNSSSYEILAPFLKDDFDFLIMLNGNQKTNYSTGLHYLNTNEEKGEFFTDFWDKIPFGTIIVNVEKVKKLEYSNTISKYIDSSHAYSGVLWELLYSQFSTNRIGVVSEKIVELGDVQKTWTDTAIRIFLYEIPLWFKLLPAGLGSYKKNVLSHYIESISQRSYLILYAKYIDKGTINKKKLFEYLKSFPRLFTIKVKAFYLLYPFYTFLVKKIRNKEV